ncbi:MAG: InlB B-repeat-containing protein [Clostridia bacterium]|nr:InlB B-repeat-containing protein [Clostridia bacterium]
MKKKKTLKLTVIILTVATLLLMILASCDPNKVTDTLNGGGLVQLPAPTGLRIEAGSLQWNPVGYATKYTVSIDGREYYSDDYSYSLNGISDGEHTFKVLANGDGAIYKTSAFSEAFSATISEGAQASTGYYGQFDELTKKESFLGYGFDVINSSVFSDKYVTTSFPIFKTEELMNQRLLKVDSKQSYVEEIKSSTMDDFLQQWNVNAKVNVNWGGKRIGGSVSVKAKYTGGMEHAKSKYFHCISIYNQKFYIVLQSDLSTYRAILSDGFITDLYSDMSPADIFSKYGTHFITSAVMGGKINSYYLYSSEEEKSYHDISAKVSTEVRAMKHKVNVDVSGGYKNEANKNNIDIKNTLEVIGGGDFGMLSDEDIPANYSEWEKSLDNHASLMGIKDSSSLIPIWDLIESEKENNVYTWDYGDGNGEVVVSRSQQLQAYFMKYGLDSYNSLMESSGLPEIINPEEIISVKINGNEAKDGVFEVYAGSNNNISFGYLPENATGFTKSASLGTATEYATIDDKSGLNLNVDINFPMDGDTVLHLILSYGNVRKIVNVRVTKKYIVSFITNNEDKIESYKDIIHGSQINAPAPIIWEGHEFKGWYKTPNFADDSLYKFGEEAVTENFTLYAKWEKIYPTVTYVHNVDYDGEKIEKVEYGAKLALPALTYYGYDFKGYYKDAEMLIPFDKETAIKENTTVYVKWKKASFTVTFNPNGGTAVEPQSVKYLENATSPTTTKEGYVLIGWYKDENCNEDGKYSFDTEKVTNNLTLYAKWEKLYPTVTYVHNVDYDGEKIEKVEYAAKLALPALTYYGYDFKGYYKDAEMLIPFDKETAIKENTTVYAKWEKVSFTVTFNPNGGTAVEPQSVKYLEKAVRPVTAKEASTFAGWYKDESLLIVFDFNNEVITKDITLFAKWSLNPVNIDFDTHGGDAIGSQTIDYGTSLGENLFTPKREGYDFKGWYEEAEYVNKVYKSTVFTSNITLHAKWEKIYPTVTYVHNVDYDGEKVEKVEYGAKLALPELTYYGYDFKGYYKDAEMLIPFDKDTAIKENTTVYVKWEKASFTVTFIPNGGTAVEPQSVKYLENATSPTTTKEGYVLIGWYKDENCNEDGKYSFDTEKVTNNLTLYAKWEKVEFSIVFHNNVSGLPLGVGIDETTDGKVKICDEKITIPEYDDEYFEIVYWITYDGNEIVDGNGNLIPDKDGYTDEKGQWIKSDEDIVELYAVWQKTRSETYVAATESDYSILLADMGQESDYILIEDLDLGGNNWTPLKFFSGNFDGLYHSIYNFNIIGGVPENNKLYYYGIFSKMESGSSVKNLQIGKEGYITSIKVGTQSNPYNHISVDAGMVSGACYGEVYNCRIISCSISMCVKTNNKDYASSGESDSNVGGISGVLRGGKIERCSISDCDFYSMASSQWDETKNNGRAGGVVGYATNACVISDCITTDCVIKSYGYSLAGSDNGWAWGKNYTGAPYARAGGIVATARKESNDNNNPYIIRCIVNSTIIEASIKKENYCYDGNKMQGVIVGEIWNGLSSEALIGINVTLNPIGSGSCNTYSVIEDSFETLINTNETFDNGLWRSDENGKIYLKFKD